MIPQPRAMTSLAARVTMIEAVVSRIAIARGPKVSAMLREARVRVQAGEAPTPILRDITTLEAAARGTGVIAAMAKAQLRMIRGIAPEPPQTVPAWRQDGRDGVGRHDEASGLPTRSTGPIPTLAGPSVSGALVDRIDQLLAAHAHPGPCRRCGSRPCQKRGFGRCQKRGFDHCWARRFLQEGLCL